MIGINALIIFIRISFDGRSKLMGFFVISLGMALFCNGIKNLIA